MTVAIPSTSSPTIGILALQGAFREHANHLKSLPISLSTILVRTPSDLSKCQALIIPGGESTAICLGAQRGQLLEPLRKWVRDGRPTWGTCAGMILLSQQATGGKKGGQDLIGGVDVRVGRNGWGSQVFSFETQISIPCLSTLPSSTLNSPSSFNGIFIRAPIVESLLDPSSSSSSSLKPNLESIVQDNLSSTLPSNSNEESDAGGKVVEISPTEVLPNEFSSSGPGSGKDGDVLRMSFAPSLQSQSQSQSGKQSSRPPIEILASLPSIPEGASPILSHKSTAITNGNGDIRVEIPNRPESDKQIVALRQGKILITSFHPELTEDNRLHEWWVRVVVLRDL